MSAVVRELPASVREVELPNGVELAIRQDSELENDAGAVVWDAALVLIHYLCKLQSQQQTQQQQQQQHQQQQAQQQQHQSQQQTQPPPRLPRLAGARVLELGAGTGAVGLAAAALGAGRVVLTDRPHLMDLIDSNIQANNLSGVAAAVPYEWGGPLPPELSAPFDVILLSDLIYETESLQPLIDTLAGFLDRHESSSGGGGGGATSNGGPAASPAGSGGGGGQQQRGVTALVSAELRTDTGIAQFVRTLVSRGYYVERVPFEELSEDWRDDDIWVFVVRRQR